MQWRVEEIQSTDNQDNKPQIETDRSPLDSISNPHDREEEHRLRFEESIKDLLKMAKSYYQTNRRINIIIVGVGLAFLANAIAHTWIPGVDNKDNAWLSLASGGLSVATFVTLFFTKSQENITKAFGNLTQIQMIYKAYCLQFDALLDFHLRHEDDADLQTINSMNSAAGLIANSGASLVQDNVEIEEAEITKTKLNSSDDESNTASSTTIKTATTVPDSSVRK
jgi:hypothetical protein